MTQTLAYQQMGTAAHGQAHALFAQTMGYVAITAVLFAAASPRVGEAAGHLIMPILGTAGSAVRPARSCS